VQRNKGENKARADIYALIFPPLIPPSIQHLLAWMLPYVIQSYTEVLQICRTVSYLVIYMRTAMGRDDIRNESDKKELGLPIFHYMMCMGLILSLTAPHSLH